MTDLTATINMLKRARVDHRHWGIREREGGVKFEGTCLVVGVDGLFGPYVEYLFDIKGRLHSITPAQQVPGSLLVARTSNNTTTTEELLED